jgi:hypothetical protein
LYDDWLPDNLYECSIEKDTVLVLFPIHYLSAESTFGGKRWIWREGVGRRFMGTCNVRRCTFTSVPLLQHITIFQAMLT